MAASLRAITFPTRKYYELSTVASTFRRGRRQLDLGLDSASPGGPPPITASRMGCLLDALEHWGLVAVVAR